MKALIILIAISGDQDKELKWWPQAAMARVCRFAVATGYKECTEYMDAKKAHEVVIQQRASHCKKWTYAYEPQERNQTCITLTNGGEKQ